MIYNVDTGVTVLDESGCKGVRLYESDDLEYVHLFIEPSCGIPEHSLPLAVSFCVLKGAGICTISGNSFTASAGDMLECPPGEPRGWRNDSTGPLEVLVIKRVAN